MSTRSAPSARSSIKSRTTHDGMPRVRRGISYSKARRPVTEEDAYSYALRAALLSHILQPRPRRKQHVAPNPKPAVQRSTTSIHDLVKDFSLMRDSKSTRFPSAFPAELEKRLTGVLYGTERMLEYKDPSVKRTFSIFMNEFRNPSFRRSVDKDRRVEDLLLIFFSKATTELQKGKTPDDDGWKLMVDRHVALFIRLISSVLKANDWSKERPELASRLQELERKLLSHSQDLASTGNASTVVEVEMPYSYELKAIPGALKVANIFGKTYDQVQADILSNKEVWTPEAALRDLKIYQTLMSINSKQTLSSDDFSTHEAYDAWRKTEIHELTQMMLAIIQAHPELAKKSSNALASAAPSHSSASTDSGFADGYQDKPSDSPYLVDQPADMSHLSLDDPNSYDDGADDTSFTFIPHDARSYYTAVLKKALSNDIGDDESRALTPEGPTAEPSLLSKQSTDVLNDIAWRWRLPQSSRHVLFLDAIRDKFQNREISLETLEQAFSSTKAPLADAKQAGKPQDPAPWDRTKCTLVDLAKTQEILISVHDLLLRELFDFLQHCYDAKPPSIGVIMFMLENHIYDDPLFARTTEDLDQFSDDLEAALRERARATYSAMLSENLPQEAEKWEFYHVIELGKAVVALCAKIQKRYRNNPTIMGVNPLAILVEEALPSFSADAGDIVRRILALTRARGEEVAIPDGFELYKELVQIRSVYAQAMAGRRFGLDIEQLLEDFVWRFIAATEEKIILWVDEAVKQDAFTLSGKAEDGDAQRHSSSALDMFRSFNGSIEQVTQLRWDNDLQYAKFMTAISKSIGAAVCRYCELIELKFMKEMEKATPEQEMAARQTTQERWMQKARETIASKDRVEPFQFNPETLVKLNDIEYVTVNLDKLEKEMNVDACAETILKHAPPVPKLRQPSKYVFTIKIIEAENLRPCDMNGFSDPYVVLGDEYQKRLAKTRIIPATLNPRWDETVDIITSGPLNLIATIWDWDALGDHDCVGRTTLKLDPLHFADFLPKEYWLDLDTQGRLLLRVSMEGEKDDIQFYYGKTFRQLKRTERDMTRKITDKLLAYIQQCLSRRTLRTVLGQGLTVSSVKALAGGYFQRAQGRPASVVLPPQQLDPALALKPLFDYFDENFALMKQTLTDPSMVMVMGRLWKEVLITLESLLVPPLSDKPSQQKSLTSQEVDVVYKWLRLLFDFFSADNDGVPLDVLRSPKYHDLQNLNFFYFEPTDNLIRESERMTLQSSARAHQHRLSLPAPHLASATPGSILAGRRAKSVMLSRNLGTIRQAKAEKRKEAQAEPSDEMILRILRMRPEAERYLKDRSRQRERLAAHAAAEAIVRQSIAAQRGGA